MAAQEAFPPEDVLFVGTASANSTFTVTVPVAVRRQLGWDEPGELFFFVSPRHRAALMLLGPPAPALLAFLGAHPPHKPDATGRGRPPRQT